MFPAREKPLSDTQKQIVRGPLDYLLKSPGKDIRRKFIQAFNEWLRIPEDKLNIITEIVGLLHTASLLYVLFSFHLNRDNIILRAH